MNMLVPTSSRRAPADGGHSLTRGLGWFSIAVGLAEVLAPRALSRSLGGRPRTGLPAAYGLRELATGIGILASADPAPWIWGRLGGDALDLGTLAAAQRRDNPNRGRAGLAFAAVAGITALDIYCLGVLRAGHAPPAPRRDYSDRRGMPQPPEAMRGAARDFRTPADMQAPEALQPHPA